MKLETWQIIALVAVAGGAYWYFTRSSKPAAPVLAPQGNALTFSLPINPTPVGYGTVLAPTS